MSPAPTGTFPADRIGAPEVPRPPQGVVEALSALSGLTCLVSDALDDLGLTATVGARLLRPVLAGRTIVGPALTVRKAEVPAGATARKGDTEMYSLASPGDVLVIAGGSDVSYLGGLAAMLSQREGTIGAVIWGGCRDVAHLREIGYPVWSKSVTPLTGVGRVETVELNRKVQVGPVEVDCGDIVVADDDGVCVIPRDRALEVVERVIRRAAADRRREDGIRAGLTLAELSALRARG